jgi:hypothetical protein
MMGRSGRPGRDVWIFAAFTAAEIALIVLVRLTAAGTDGGDLCRDFVDAGRLLQGHAPYAPIATCGPLHHSPHPPLAFLLLVSLATLPVPAAALLWDLLMLAALVAALWLIWVELGAKMPLRWLALGLGALVVWTPLLDTWLEGQIGPLVLLLLVLAWRARRTERPWAAGIWLAVATLIRLYPILLFVYPLLRREWRLTIGGIAAGIGLTVMTLPFVGIGDYLRYIFVEAPASSAEWINDAHNISLRGWLGQIFVGSNTIHPIISAPGLVTPLFILGVAAALGVLLWRSWQARFLALGSVGDESAWLLALPVMLLISPLAWPHYAVILLLPWILAGFMRWQEGRWSIAALALVAAVALFDLQALGVRALFDVPRLLPWPVALFIYALPFYALLLSFGVQWAYGESWLPRHAAFPKVLVPEE